MITTAEENIQCNLFFQNTLMIYFSLHQTTKEVLNI